MVDDQQRELITADIFLSEGQVLRIHDEGNFCPLFRTQTFEMSYLGGIEGRQVLGSLQRHHIFNTIDPADGVSGSGEKSATFVGGECSGMRHDVVKDVLRNDEIRHGTQIVLVSV